MYTQWEIPDHPVVPQHMIGAITWIRNNSTPPRTPSQTTHPTNPRPAARTRNRPRLQPAVRTPARHRIALQYLQTTTQLRPAPHRRQIQFHVQLARPRPFPNHTALVAHHKRTGKDISRWYGNHFPTPEPDPSKKPPEHPKTTPAPRSPRAKHPKALDHRGPHTKNLRSSPSNLT